MSDRTIWTTATPTVGKGFSRQIQAFGGSFSIATGDLSLNKTVSLFKVPANMTVTNVVGYVTDMDTNGAPALVFSIGDSGSASRVISSSSSAQAGGSPTINASAILGYQFTAETEIVWTTATASATAAAGTLVLHIHGYID